MKHDWVTSLLPEEKVNSNYKKKLIINISDSILLVTWCVSDPIYIVLGY